MLLWRAWRKMSRRSTTGTACAAIAAESTDPGPTGGSWSASPAPAKMATHQPAAGPQLVSGASVTHKSTTESRQCRGQLEGPHQRALAGRSAAARPAAPRPAPGPACLPHPPAVRQNPCSCRRHNTSTFVRAAERTAISGPRSSLPIRTTLLTEIRLKPWTRCAPAQHPRPAGCPPGR